MSTRWRQKHTRLNTFENDGQAELPRPAYIIIIIRVARLLLKLGRGELSAQGLDRNGCVPSILLVVDIALFRFWLKCALGIGIKSIVLPRYRGPINLSLTDLLRRGIPGLSTGGGANLSGLSVPSSFFSPASMARSLLMALRFWERRK